MGLYLEHLIDAGYQVELVSWLPITTHYVTVNYELVKKSIHFIHKGKVVYISRAMHDYLASDPDIEQVPQLGEKMNIFSVLYSFDPPDFEL